VSEVPAQVAAWMEAAADLQRRVPAACGAQIAASVEVIATSMKSGGKLLLCGNGGSAADCQHVATELVSRLSRDFERPALAAVALTTDTSFLTAFGNDYGFEGVFARQVEALGRPGDVLLGISTSGHSKNVRRAVQVARERGLTTIGLVGEGGPLSDEVDIAIVIPDRDTQHVQEAMLPVEHLICGLVERAVFEDTEE
jgi:D-sedoheptulose 7-phosphate isomerase